MIGKIQREADVWQREQFGVRPAYEMQLGIIEEIGELAHAELKSMQGIRGTKEELLAKAANAVGDIAIYAVQNLTLHDVEFEELDLWEIQGVKTPHVCITYLCRNATAIALANNRFATLNATGNLFSFLAGYCKLKGLNLQDELEKVWNEVKQRN